MPTTTRFPTANGLGDIGNNWTNRNNAHADDGADASMVHSGLGSAGDSRWFNFDFDSVIPNGDAITSVKAIIEWSPQQLTTMEVFPEVPDALGPETVIDDVPVTSTLDLTALTAWTRTKLLDANFALRISVSSDANQTIGMDYVKVEVVHGSPPEGTAGMFDPHLIAKNWF